MQSRRSFISQSGAVVGGISLGLAFADPILAEGNSGADANLTGLIQVLESVGKPTKTYNTPDGTSVLVIPFGGRVLGLFAPGSDENFYWTNSALKTTETAREFYAGEQWKNSGGDRTWLAPEVDLFFPNFPNRDVYFQQRSLDPGNYQVVGSKEDFKLVNNLTVKFSRSGNEVPLQITKGFGPARNPLRYERGLRMEGVDYAGYTQHTSLEFQNEGQASLEQVGVWNLIQMPHGGDLLLPTFGRAAPRHIFSTVGTIPAEDLIISDHLVRYRMRQQGEHKISLRAVSVANRIGYLYRTEDKWSLIIRNFVVNPSGEYVDVPWNDTEDFGFAVQACNVNSKLGLFSELEYHTPAIGRNTGRIECNDQAQVWAFRGSRSDIEVIAKTLLTPEPWPAGEA